MSWLSNLRCSRLWSLSARLGSAERPLLTLNSSGSSKGMLSNPISCAPHQLCCIKQPDLCSGLECYERLRSQHCTSPALHSYSMALVKQYVRHLLGARICWQAELAPLAIICKTNAYTTCLLCDATCMHRMSWIRGSVQHEIWSLQ